MAVRETSIAVYHQIKNEGLLSAKRLQVYEILLEYGALTGSQVAQIYKSKYPSNNHSETIRNRITELVEMKVLEEIGIVNCPFSGRNVIQFGLTNNLPKKLTVKKTKKQKINEAILELDQAIKLCNRDIFGAHIIDHLEEVKSQLKEI